MLDCAGVLDLTLVAPPIGLTIVKPDLLCPNVRRMGLDVVRVDRTPLGRAREDLDRLVVVVPGRALVETSGYLRIRWRLAGLKRYGKFPVLRLPVLDGRSSNSSPSS